MTRIKNTIFFFVGLLFFSMSQLVEGIIISTIGVVGLMAMFGYASAKIEFDTGSKRKR